MLRNTSCAEVRPHQFNSTMYDIFVETSSHGHTSTEILAGGVGRGK